MSNPLADAIKKKRMSSMSHDLPSHDGGEGGGGKDLLGIVASLNPDERNKLKDILHASTDNSMEIQKGGASSEEQGKIQSQIQDDDERQELEAGEAPHDPSQEGSENESDDIAKSMLDSKYRNGPIQAKPRNLAERARNHIAAKLKSKGKL